MKLFFYALTTSFLLQLSNCKYRVKSGNIDRVPKEVKQVRCPKKP